MKRIVIPTDFSEISDEATEFGLKLAQDLNLKVMLIHAYQMPHAGASNLISIIEDIRKNAENEMANLMSKYKTFIDSNQVEVESKCIEGDVFEVLTNYVDTDGSELIVMGTLGATGIERQLLGSNASKVIKKIDCPVLVVPPTSEYSFSNGIIFGIDEDTRVRSSDLLWLKSINKLSKDIPLQLVNILSEEEGFEESLLSIPAGLEDIEVNLTELIGDDIVAGLEECVNTANSDCLVLVKRNLNFFEKLVTFSVSRDMATVTRIPLLVIRSRKDL